MQVTDAMVAAACDAYSRGTVHGLDGKIRAALEAAMAEMWRPIEEAPKDGTYVLVWRPDEGDGHHEAHAGIDVWMEQSWYRSRRYQQPTHFMTLPPPPRGK